MSMNFYKAKLLGMAGCLFLMTSMQNANATYLRPILSGVYSGQGDRYWKKLKEEIAPATAFVDKWGKEYIRVRIQKFIPPNTDAAIGDDEFYPRYLVYAFGVGGGNESAHSVIINNRYLYIDEEYDSLLELRRLLNNSDEIMPGLQWMSPEHIALEYNLLDSKNVLGLAQTLTPGISMPQAPTMTAAQGEDFRQGGFEYFLQNGQMSADEESSLYYNDPTDPKLRGASEINPGYLMEHVLWSEQFPNAYEPGFSAASRKFLGFMCSMAFLQPDFASEENREFANRFYKTGMNCYNSIASPLFLMPNGFMEIDAQFPVNNEAKNLFLMGLVQEFPIFRKYIQADWDENQQLPRKLIDNLVRLSTGNSKTNPPLIPSGKLRAKAVETLAILVTPKPGRRDPLNDQLDVEDRLDRQLFWKDLIQHYDGDASSRQLVMDVGVAANWGDSTVMVPWIQRLLDEMANLIDRCHYIPTERPYDQPKIIDDAKVIGLIAGMDSKNPEKAWILSRMNEILAEMQNYYMGVGNPRSVWDELAGYLAGDGISTPPDPPISP